MAGAESEEESNKASPAQPSTAEGIEGTKAAEKAGCNKDYLVDPKVEKWAREKFIMLVTVTMC